MIPRLILRVLFLVVASALLALPASAQFGVPKKNNIKELLLQQQAEINAGGEADAKGSSFLSAQDAADMEAIITQANSDPETMELVKRMKAEKAVELGELGKESEHSILKGMKQALDEIKMLDYLFKDKERALREMEKDGMIDKRKLKEYKKNPDLLEDDTRKGLYFSFVSLAVAGGYM